jgi:branched-chain amino acid transport system substrate-binding protein
MRQTLIRKLLAALGLIVLCSAGAGDAQMGPIRIGYVSSYSGPLAFLAKTQDAAIATFIRQHGDTVAGRKIQIIKRDEAGPNPDTARRLTQELIVDQHVDYLAGYMYTPNGVAAGQIAAQAKTPMLIVNSSGPNVLENNPYSVRLGYSVPQMIVPLARWAPAHGLKNIYVITLDFASGIETADFFEKNLIASGGRVAGEIRVPLTAMDFSSYMVRIRDAKPDAILAFISIGGGSQAFLNAYVNSGLAKDGVKLITGADLNSEPNLVLSGDALVGATSMANYSSYHQSKLNDAYVKSVTELAGVRPEYISVGAYDIMAAIYKTIELQNGNINPDRTMSLLKGMKLESPRGPIQIDAQTRDVIQDIYVLRTVHDKAGIHNVEVETLHAIQPNGTPGS